MTVISKEIFYRNISRETPCSILHLWSSSCINGVSVIAMNVCFGCLKFFGPIYVLKLLLNWKKFDGKYLISQIIAYMRTILYGIIFSILLFGGLCSLTRISQLSYYTVMRAGFISGLSILVESQENKTLDSMLFFNQVVEGLINVYTNDQSKGRPRWAETFVFMIISSLLMYLFKTQSASPKFTHLWFHPVKSLYDQQHYTNASLPSSCLHKSSCIEYAYKAGLKYFCAGYALEIIKNTLPRAGRLFSKPRILFDLLRNRKNALFGLFFGSYAFLYRCITCRLRKGDGGESPVHSLIGGFIAGSTYYFRPNIQIPIIGFTTTLQLLWQRLRNKYDLPNFPYDLIVFMVSSGILLHFRFLVEDYCPKYTKNMIDTVTNNVSKDILRKLWCIISESDGFLNKSIL